MTIKNHKNAVMKYIGKDNDKWIVGVWIISSVFVYAFSLALPPDVLNTNHGLKQGRRGQNYDKCDPFDPLYHSSAALASTAGPKSKQISEKNNKPRRIMLESFRPFPSSSKSQSLKRQFVFACLDGND